MQNTSTPNSTKTKIGFYLFSISLLAFAAIFGGEFYENVVEVPNWSADIPNTLVAYRNFIKYSNPGNYYQTLVPFTIVSLVVSLVLLWNKSKSASKWMLIALGGIVFSELLEVIYMFPLLDVLFFKPLEGVPTDKLITANSQWKAADLAVEVVVFLTMIAFLRAYNILSSNKSE